MKPIYRILGLCIFFCIIFSLFPSVQAHEDVAQDLTGKCTFQSTCFEDTSFLHNENTKTYRSSSGSGTVTVSCTEEMAGLYLYFDLEYGAYTVTDNATGQSLTAGESGFLHEYIDLYCAFGTYPTSVTICFNSGSVRLSEISVYSAGQTPDHVQRWQQPHEGGADLVLFATHGDDDQLFFAGLLPYYAAQADYRVQVVYLTDHRNLTNSRTHEMLNGLWAVGVTAYPVFGSFADFRIDDLQGSYDYYETLGTSKEDLLSFVVEQIRRFKPQVAVGHDINGEYGHGMHMVYTDLLIQSISLTADANAFPESAQQYGIWEIPKLYLHLYEENQVIMDYDQPLEAFNGLTAFQVTQQLGYPCHESQQWTWFTDWINGYSGEITKASQIKTYNPCIFGLYHSTVGPDVAKNDLFENIIPYAEQERLEQERLEQERLEQERLEQERLEQERLEQERLEQERLEQERLEQERLEQERLEQERLEQERLEQERLEQEQIGNRQAEQKKLYTALGLLAILVFFLILTLRKIFRRKNL